MTRDLPSGTVTFLFTDIEGSTTLLKQLGERYGEVLREQQRILREAVGQHGGREVDSQGDSFFFAFPRANEALGAAVTAQRALAEQEWPEGGEVRVRMGLHTGEPTVGDERYVGLGVHRAARIGAVAHGGQVVLSSATRELVEEEKAGVVVRELGAYELKDIDRPERLYQLDIEGLQTAFPPLKAVRVEEQRPQRRRTIFVAALAAVLAAAVAVPLFALGRGSSGNSAALVATASIAANSVGALDVLSGRPFGASAIATAPDALAVGEGSVWATTPETESVARIDPKTHTRSGAVGLGSSPTGVAAGGGFAWVTNGLQGSVSKIDPNGNGGSGAVVDTIPVGNGPSGVAYGAGRVWVANSTDRTVSEIDPGSDKPLSAIPLPQGADAIAYGSGFVWVVSGTANTVSRIEARSRTVLPSINVGNGPRSVAVGAGAAWVTNSLDGTVSRIDPSTGVTSVISVGGNPSGVAAGNGAVWVSDPRAETLSRIDPAVGKVVQTLKTTNPPGGLAAAAGTLYVAVGTPALEHHGGTLTVLSTDGIDSIDPAVGYSPLSWSVLSTTNDGLVTFQRLGGSDGARIVPDLATSPPTISDGGMTYTFQVRPGIRYSTGALVQPADILRGIERSLQYQAGKQPMGAGFYLSGIVGAAACEKAPGSCDLSKGIVIDQTARTITFHLTAPDPDFLDKLALPSADAVPANTPLKSRLPLPATGPYMIASSNQRLLTLVRNPRFHEWSTAAQPDGYPDRIAYKFGAAAKAQVSAVEQAAADYTSITPSLIAALRRSGYANQLHTNPTIATDFFFLSTKLAPFNNLAVRRALNYAVDRNRLAQLDAARIGNPTRPSCQVLPPNFVGYARYCLYPHDLAKAKRLVAASGTRGQTVTVWAASEGREMSAYLVSVLQSLGYKAQLKVLSPSDKYYATVLSGRREFQTGPTGWFADYPSPSQFFTPVLTCASARASLTGGLYWNISAFCNPGIDREINQARALQISDPQAASVLWSKIDRDIMKQAPWVPLDNHEQSDLVSRRAGNYQYNPQWGPLFDQIWVR